MKAVLLLVLAYLLGSIPTGYLVVRLGGKKDIRELGSRSTGATNVLRVRGWKAGLAVGLVDVFKGYLPVMLAAGLSPDPLLPPAAGVLAVLGHCFPFAIGFKGGKGVATSVGAYARLAPPALGPALAVFVVIVAATRYVSLGSVISSGLLPVLILAFGGRRETFYASLLIAALVVFQHRANIRRLLRKEERKLGDRVP
jgi:glycerol-3-phosphate acyltransferase PlsY